MTSRRYLARVGKVKLKTIKDWCRQILRGLEYLHTHDPPIIHRDIKVTFSSLSLSLSIGRGPSVNDIPRASVLHVRVSSSRTAHLLLSLSPSIV